MASLTQAHSANLWHATQRMLMNFFNMLLYRLMLCLNSVSHRVYPAGLLFVAEKHDTAWEAFLAWLYCGESKSGYYFNKMKRTRALFKLALRYCRNHIEELKADACAGSLFDQDEVSLRAKVVRWWYVYTPTFPILLWKCVFSTATMSFLFHIQTYTIRCGMVAAAFSTVKLITLFPVFYFKRVYFR